METILERMKKYFENTSAEQVKEDWAKTEKYDKVESPNVDTFIEISNQLIDIGKPRYNLPSKSLINNFENPNFSSDFF